MARKAKVKSVVHAQFLIALAHILILRQRVPRTFFEAGAARQYKDPTKWLYYCIGHCMDRDSAEDFIEDYVDFCEKAGFPAGDAQVDHSEEGSYE